LTKPKLEQLDKELYKWFTATFCRKTCDWTYDNWKKLSIFTINVK